MLTKCPECELMVSDKAAACPHCGYPMSLKAKRERPSTKRHRLPNGFGQISKIKDLTERVYTKREIEWLQKELAKIPSGEIFGFEK